MADLHIVPCPSIVILLAILCVVNENMRTTRKPLNF